MICIGTPVHETVLIDGTLLRHMLTDHPVKLRDHHITLLFGCSPNKKCRRIRCDPVITVQKLQVFSPRQIDPPIARV